MADVRMALAQLLEKASDVDLLRERVGYLAPRLMAARRPRVTRSDPART